MKSERSSTGLATRRSRMRKNASMTTNKANNERMGTENQLNWMPSVSAKSRATSPRLNKAAPPKSNLSVLFRVDISFSAR